MKSLINFSCGINILILLKNKYSFQVGKWSLRGSSLNLSCILSEGHQMPMAVVA